MKKYLVATCTLLVLMVRPGSCQPIDTYNIDAVNEQRKNDVKGTPLP